MAANSRSLKAGKAFVEFSLKDGKVRNQLRNLQKRFAATGAALQRLGGIGAKVGGAVATAFAVPVKIFTSVGDSLDKMSQRTGFSVESLSELGFAAEQSGSDLTTLESSIKKMQATMLKAERGGAAAKDTFNDLGLEFSTLKDLSPEGQLKLISDRLAGIEDPTKRAALAMQIFGGAGQKLLPLLSGGSAGMESLKKEAHDLGLTISGETAASAAALADKMNIVKKVLTRVAVAVGEALSPALQKLADYVTENIGGLISWVKTNSELISTTALWSAGIGVAGIALIGLGSALNVVATGIAGVNIAMGFLIANPVAAGLAIVAGAIGLIALEALRASGEIDGINKAISKLNRNRTVAGSDELRIMVTRFEQLAAKTKLSTAEQKEARKIIHDLRVEYGDLASFVDASSGKIVKVQKTLAQLRAAQGGQSQLSLKTQIGLEELAIVALKAEGDAVDEVRKREERLAALRKKLKATDAIVSDAKPFEASTAPSPIAETVPPIEGGKESGERAGEEFGKAFIDLVSTNVTRGVEVLEDAIEFTAEKFDTVVEAVNRGIDAASQIANAANQTKGITNIAALQSLQGGTGPDPLLEVNKKQLAKLDNIDRRGRRDGGQVAGA